MPQDWREASLNSHSAALPLAHLHSLHLLWAFARKTNSLRLLASDHSHHGGTEKGEFVDMPCVCTLLGALAELFSKTRLVTTPIVFSLCRVIVVGDWVDTIVHTHQQLKPLQTQQV